MTAAFSFSYGPRLRSVAGICAQLADLLPPGPVLLVTDAGVRRFGLCDGALAALKGRAVVVFDAVEADPSAKTVLAAVEAGRAGGVASVVGLGGGSPMDVAKLVAYLLGSGDDLAAIYGVDQAKGQRLPLVLIPTTAGTGSEATPIAIVTVGETEKKGVVAPALYADWALLDADLTLGLPPAATAATGIDAMVHAIEAYTSARLKNPVSDALAKEALRLLSANLPKVLANGRDVAAREAMLLGSHLAGVAFSNAPVAAVHALAYPLGGHFHVPHGLSNALMLRPVLRYNQPAAGALYGELATCLDPTATESAEAAFFSAIDALLTGSGLPLRLRDIDIPESALELLAREAMKQQRLLINNPRLLEEADALALYRQAW
jgi:alcohol dehydrogenase class IV